MTITASALATARTLLAQQAQHRAELARLKQRLHNAKTADKAWRTLLDERLAFRWHPERLADLAQLYQSVPSRYRHSIAFNYRSFLRSMIDPFPSLEPGLPNPKPRTVDFAGLPPAARCYLLGPYLGIHQNNRFAEVDLARSDPPRHIVMMQTGGPVDVELWRQQLPAVTAWLGGGAATGPLAGDWTITAHTANTITLTLQPPLPATIPFDRRYLRPGALFAGLDLATRTPVHISFADLPAGTYIPGISGTGKTSALHLLLRSIFANLDLFAAVHLVDGKNGVAFHRYARLHPKVRVCYDEPDAWQLAADLVATMRERNLAQRALGTDKTTKDFIALVVDELPTFIVPPPKALREQHQQFLTDLQTIATKGRSAGLRMFLTTQTPVNEQIPTMVRANCQNVIAFRLPEQSHATGLFGTLDSINDPRKLMTGQAVFAQGEIGTVCRVQFPFAPLYQPWSTRA